MFWQEKIQVIKSRFPSSHFKDPFRHGNGIIENILLRLLNTSWLNFHNSTNKAELLPESTPRLLPLAYLYTEALLEIEDEKNYWLLLVHVPLASDFRVYECRKIAMKALLSQCTPEPIREFYIVDKKYKWLRYFRADKMKGVVEVYAKGCIC